MAKKNYVEKMFDNIAPTYDKLNHILSLNFDKCWRKKAVKRIKRIFPWNVLDVACGTGDMAIALRRAGAVKVTGVDISEGMLEVGRRKIRELGLDNIELKVDDAENLSFDDCKFDAVSVAFGVRNFEHLEQGLKEFHRVLTHGGLLCILELSVPSNSVLRWLYKLYFLHVLPYIGGLISGDKEAYRYLPTSVMNFPKPEVVCDMLRRLGFSTVKARPLTFGLCRMYEAVKV